MNIKITYLKKIGIPVSLLVCAVLLGLIAPRLLQNQTLTFLVFAVLFGTYPVYKIYKNPNIGFLIFIPMVMLVPFAIGTGTESSINLALILVILLTALWAVEIIFLKKIPKGEITPLIFSVLFFFVIVLVSFAFGQIRWYPIDSAPLRTQIGGAVLYMLSGWALLLAGYRLHDLRILKWMVYSFLGAGVIYLINLTVSNLGLAFSLIPNGAAGSIFWIWLICLSFSMAILNDELPIYWRICFGIVFLWGAGYSITPQNIGWTSGWAPALGSVFLIVLLSKPRWSLVILAAFILMVVLNFQSVVTVLMAGDNTYSLSTREVAWQIVTQIIKVDPLFGLGFGNYYFYTPIFPIMGYFVNFNSHNNYLDIVAQMGLIGLVSVFWIYFEIGKIGLKLRQKVKSGFSYAYILAAIGGLVGMVVTGMLGDWVLPFVYNVGFSGFRSSVIGWIFLGGLIMISRQPSNLKD